MARLLPNAPGRYEIESAGRGVATSLAGQCRSPLSELEAGRITIKDAYREGRLFSYSMPTKTLDRAQVDHITRGCAGLLANSNSTERTLGFICLMSVNNASPHDATGRITDLQYIEAALDVAYRMLTEGK